MPYYYCCVLMHYFISAVVGAWLQTFISGGTPVSHPQGKYSAWFRGQFVLKIHPIQQYGQDCIRIRFLYPTNFLMLCRQAMYTKQPYTSGHMAHTFNFMSYKHYTCGLKPDPHVISDALKQDLFPHHANKSSRYLQGHVGQGEPKGQVISSKDVASEHQRDPALSKVSMGHACHPSHWLTIVPWVPCVSRQRPCFMDQECPLKWARSSTPPSHSECALMWGSASLSYRAADFCDFIASLIIQFVLIILQQLKL